ncbi:alanine racemase [Vibrio sp. 10N.222.52.C3]|uniref:alanine racemase n=1 Tax=unclassified Vibrio TaxID=2614977 RepID=UPI00354B0E9C
MITAQAHINLDAIRHNYQVLKKLCGHQKLVAVIKGNAYGHNAIAVAKSLPNADLFAVARIEEAVELRDAGIKQPILLLEGCFCSNDLKQAFELDLDIVIHSEQQLKDLEQASLANVINVWIKVDSGMHRLGIQPQEISDYITRLKRLDTVSEPISFLSHFSCADDTQCTTTQEQITVFSNAVKDKQGMKSIANSAGILLWPNSKFDVARAGIALYGISPQSDSVGKDFGLIPAMTFSTRLISVRHHDKGQPVGYGGSWISDKETTLGVIAVGYGDGYPRAASNHASVFINGRSVPIVGRVSMDMIVVNLGKDAQDKCGDSVELWGENLPIESVAHSASTIPYELTIQLTSRVHKKLV